MMYKKILTIAVLLAAACTMSQAQLLYRISGKGLEHPSYLIGTYHLAPVSFVDSIAGVAEALQACEQVYGELDMEDMMSPANMELVQKAQMMPEGKTLRNLFTKEEMVRINAVMTEVMGMDMSNEAVAAQMDKLTPAALSSTLTIITCMKKNPGFNPANSFDGYFQKVALQSGKTVKGFETTAFQMEVLYGTPLDQQAKDLLCLADNFAEAVDMIEFITAAFFSQDIEQLADLFAEEEEGPCQSDPEESAALIDKRNDNWLGMMPAIMQEKPTFFAVGAGHLVGENGLLNRLREMGYTVEGVK